MKHKAVILFLILCINQAYTQENKIRIIPPHEIIAETVYKSLDIIYNHNEKINIEIYSNYKLPWKQLESIKRKSIKNGFKQISNNFTINFNNNTVKAKTEFALSQDISSFLKFKIIGHSFYDNYGQGLQISPYFDITNSETKIDSLTDNFNTTIENLLILNENYENIQGDLWIETSLVREFDYVTISQSDTGKTFSYGSNKFKLLSFENGIAVFRIYEKELNFRFLITNDKENLLYTKCHAPNLKREVYEYFIENYKSINQEEFIYKYAELTKGLRLDDPSLSEILVIACGKIDYKVHFYKPVDYNAIVTKIKL